jgi:hypothetical protein
MMQDLWADIIDAIAEEGARRARERAKRTPGKLAICVVCGNPFDTWRSPPDKSCTVCTLALTEDSLDETRADLALVRAQLSAERENSARTNRAFENLLEQQVIDALEKEQARPESDRAEERRRSELEFQRDAMDEKLSLIESVLAKHGIPSSPTDAGVMALAEQLFAARKEVADLNELYRLTESQGDHARVSLAKKLKLADAALIAAAAKTVAIKKERDEAVVASGLAQVDIDCNDAEIIRLRAELTADREERDLMEVRYIKECDELDSCESRLSAQGKELDSALSRESAALEKLAECEQGEQRVGRLVAEAEVAKLRKRLPVCEECFQDAATDRAMYERLAAENVKLREVKKWADKAAERPYFWSGVTFQFVCPGCGVIPEPGQGDLVEHHIYETCWVPNLHAAIAACGAEPGKKADTSAEVEAGVSRALSDAANGLDGLAKRAENYGDRENALTLLRMAADMANLNADLGAMFTGNYAEALDSATSIPVPEPLKREEPTTPPPPMRKGRRSR